MARIPRGLYKRSDSNYWWMVLKIKADKKPQDKNPQYKRESTKETSLEKAKDVFDRRRKEVKACPDRATQDTLTLTDLENHYVATIRGKVSECKVSLAFKHLRNRLGNIPLDKVTPLQLSNYISQRQHTDKVQPATVRKEVSYFKTALRKALKLDLVSDALALKLLRVETPKAPKGRVRYLTIEEAIRLLKCCPSWLQPIVVTALYTGLRMGELRSLKWKQFDSAAGYLSLPKTKNGERRDVPLMGTAFALLRSRYQLGRRSAFIFADSQGRPFTRSHIDHEFLDVIHRACVEDFRFHDTRHTFASWAAMGGVEIYAICKLLGHLSIKSTEIYTHLSPNHITRQVLLLDDRHDSIARETVNTNNFRLLHDYFTFGEGKDDLDPIIFSLPSLNNTEVSTEYTETNPNICDAAA